MSKSQHCQLFSEIYSAYYNAVAAVIRTAQDGSLDSGSLFDIVRDSAFPESVLTIVPALENGSWPLIKKDWTTNIRHTPTMPLSLLQRQWLKALCADPRIRLLAGDAELSRLEADLSDVEPLFRPEDFCLYDAYSDADDCTAEPYVANFRTAMRAIHGNGILLVEYRGRGGRIRKFTCRPCKMEFSQKDGKFRLVSRRKNRRITCNMCRIVSCGIVQAADELPDGLPPDESRTVTLEIYDGRKAMERAMHEFAHFERSCIHVRGGVYRLTLSYNALDETEMVIRVLSFGPMIRVIAPDEFACIVKERIRRQMELMGAQR